MEKVNIESLKKFAKNLMFDMEERQYETLLDEFSIILQQMELISNIEGIDSAEPMSFPFKVETTYLREDEALPPLDVNEALKNAGNSVVEDQIRLPKVVN